MQKILLKTLTFLCYLISFGIIGYYFYIEINPFMALSPPIRLIFLCSGCVFLYLGSLFLSLSLDKYATKIMKTTFFILFFLYISILVYFTLFDVMFGRNLTIQTLFNWNNQIFQEYSKFGLKLIPFATIFLFFNGFLDGNIGLGSMIINLLGNIVAFVPFAFFIPLLFKKINTYPKFLLIITISVFLIEVSQFAFRIGVFDIDDFILNIGGATIFYFLLKIKHVKNAVRKLTLGFALDNN